jgi:hypothetical protein
MLYILKECRIYQNIRKNHVILQALALIQFFLDVARSIMTAKYRAGGICVNVDYRHEIGILMQKNKRKN